jgi:tetratricopeptide (TPR) repeat protein
LNLGICEENLNHDSAAIELYREARAVAEKWSPQHKAASLLRLAGYELRTGEPVRALALFEEAVDDARRTGLPYWEGEALHKYGEALVALGRPTDALPHLRAALAVAERAGDLKPAVYATLAAASEAAGD